MYLLIPSPLLGPETWRPVAEALEAAGEEVRIASVDTALGLTQGAVVVPHSNAGYFASSLGPAARATVYVDAALPFGDQPEVALAPPDFYAFLETLADTDGLLPPWTAWWDDLGDLFPDEATRVRVEAEQPRLPLTYFRSRVPVFPGWDERPNAYLAFGTTYADEVAFARESHWPLVELDGGHLHQLHDPEGVASAIVALADEAGR